MGKSLLDHLERKPWAVRSSRLMRRSISNSAMLLNGRFSRLPGNTNSLPVSRCSIRKISIECSDNGTR